MPCKGTLVGTEEPLIFEAERGVSMVGSLFEKAQVGSSVEGG